MKKRAKLPTIIGLIILFVGLISGVFLINSKTIFKLGAQSGTNPKNVRISNITDSSVTISWTTDIKTVGFVKWGESQSNIAKVSQDTLGEGFTHWTTLINLKPGIDIFFKINSNDHDWDNNGVVWQTKTLSQKLPLSENLNISGTVVTQSGDPSTNTIIYASVNGTLVSTTSSTSGGWLIPLSNFTKLDTDKTILEITVEAGTNGSASALIYPLAAKNTPLIILGKTYDFRTLDPSTGGTLPESELSIPDAITASSRFEVGENTSQETKVVTLESIDEGEIITTTGPEFFGNAPEGVEIEITVESEAQTTILTSNQKGLWSWNPPNDLEPGQHTITIKWKDDNGILHNITRSFVVAAAEGPAFESTPSATPTQTQNPTTTPTSTPIEIVTSTPQASISATNPPLPESGVLTPTLGLFIMGTGILMSSLFVYKTANG